MRVGLVAIGRRLPAWINEGFHYYAKRLNQNVRLELVELAAAKRSRSKQVNLSQVRQYKTEEAQRIVKHIRSNNRLIVLDQTGKQWSTAELASRMTLWLQQGQDVSLIIGGPDGLDNTLMTQADERWSLSHLTFPHALVRVMVAEQLYRAWSLLHNHPYHRE